MRAARKKLTLRLVVLFLVNILVITAAQAATYRAGSTGETVRQVQQKLQAYGYNPGTVDGIYGTKTAAAVRRFQQANGLAVDGIAGAETLAALVVRAASSSREADVTLLARVISAEARGEPYAGQVAVGAVILNRTRHPSFPSTIAGVVYQPGAFSCMTDGQINQPVSDSAVRAAQEALGGNDPSGGAIYYFNPATATSSWIWSRPLIKMIGQHRFCK